MKLAWSKINGQGKRMHTVRGACADWREWEREKGRERWLIEVREESKRERERDSREVIYRKLPRSPESHYKHWAIACMWLTSCAAKEHVSPKRASERASDSREEGFFLPLGKEVKNRLSKIREMRTVWAREIVAHVGKWCRTSQSRGRCFIYMNTVNCAEGWLSGCLLLLVFRYLLV